MPVEKQIAIFYCGTKGLLKNVPVGKVKQFEKEYLEFLELKHADVLETLSEGVLDDNVTDVLNKVAEDISAKFQEKEPVAGKD